MVQIRLGRVNGSVMRKKEKCVFGNMRNLLIWYTCGVRRRKPTFYTAVSSIYMGAYLIHGSILRIQCKEDKLIHGSIFIYNVRKTSLYTVCKEDKLIHGM